MCLPKTTAHSCTLPVRLDKEQLDGSFLVLAEEAEGSYVSKWETCAICFEPVKGAREGVYLFCQKHCFHGRCIVPPPAKGSPVTRVSSRAV